MKRPRYNPPTAVLGIEDVKKLLRTACAIAGSQGGWARANGISAGYVSDILQGRREPGPDALRALKLRRVVRYVEDAGSAGVAGDLGAAERLEAERLADADVEAELRGRPVLADREDGL